MKESEINWDVIVIGSGASGGRISKFLHDKGAKVLLIEAGKFFKAKDFPKSEMQASLDLYWSGGAELDEKAELGFLRGKGVGGTTLVNQALLDRFDSSVWDEWAARSGIDFQSMGLNSLYDEVESSISIQKISEKNYGANTKKFIKAFESQNLNWSPLRRGQSDCALDKGMDCMQCLGGCPRNSKQSTLVTSIEPAVATGMSVIANCNVQHIENTANSIFVHANQLGTKLKLNTKKLVLAAGSFGTTEILLRSQLPQMSSSLGEKISCHPQYMVYSLFDDVIDGHKGAFQCVKSDDSTLRTKGFKFENVFAPPIATAMLMGGFGKSHQKKMLKYPHLASMEVAVRDEPVGQMKIDRKSQRRVYKPLTDQDKSRRDQGIQLIKEMYSKIGAKEIIQGKAAFGLHLMGGCSLGVSENNSVVSPDFSLHCAPNIYCADSAIFPSSSGVNPSLTIMAFSQLAAKNIARSLGL